MVEVEVVVLLLEEPDFLRPNQAMLERSVSWALGRCRRPRLVQDIRVRGGPNLLAMLLP